MLQKKLAKFGDFEEADSSLQIWEEYRRLFLAKVIYSNLFPKEERKKAYDKFATLSDIAKRKAICCCELIGNIVDTGKCPEEPFFEENLEYLLLVAYYLLYGNPDLEFDLASREQRDLSKKHADKILTKYQLNDLVLD